VRGAAKSVCIALLEVLMRGGPSLAAESRIDQQAYRSITGGTYPAGYKSGLRILN
jgi:hypothetical protein